VGGEERKVITRPRETAPFGDYGKWDDQGGGVSKNEVEETMDQRRGSYQIELCCDIFLRGETGITPTGGGGLQKPR